MKPKCAWIDYEGGLHVLFAMELREKGIQLDARSTLEEFSQEFDLNNYPVLLYHPGLKRQGTIPEVVAQYPKTKVALIISPCSSTDYTNLNSDMPCFTYDAESVAKFILENQH